MKIDPEFIHSHKTPRGGWNAKQLAALGVRWPPKHGWIDRVCAREHDERAVAEFVRLSGRGAPSLVRELDLSARSHMRDILGDRPPWE